MNRTFRAFLCAYAVALIVLAVGQGFAAHASSSSDAWQPLWLSIGAASVSYFLLALGYLAGKDRAKAPAWPWLAAVFGAALSLLALGGWGSDAIFQVVPLVAYLSLSALMLYEFRSKAITSRNIVRRILIMAALVGGCGLTLSSVFLNITLDGGDSTGSTGWSVVVRRGVWVTSGINVGSDTFGQSGIKWLMPIYAYPGYLVYLLALLASLAMVVWVAWSRVSMRRLQASRALGWFTAISSFACLAVYTDIFWGWHAYLASDGVALWNAVLATALWAAGPLFAVVLLAPGARGQSGAWRLRAVAIF